MKTESREVWQSRIHNLAGSHFSNFLFLVWKYGIHRGYRFKVFLTGLLSFIVSLISLPDRIVMAVRRRRVNAEAPVFILGHWRSGTTLLHNLFCLDENNGYSSTIGVVFPENLAVTRAPVRWFMKLFMPAARPVDHVKLDPEFPQEEEMAIGNLSALSFYNWMYFPEAAGQFRERLLDLKALTPRQQERWKRVYLKIVRNSLADTGRKRYVSKNPPHTARIPLLVGLFPDARFVYIVRNPYEVIESSFAFFSETLAITRLQAYPPEQLQSDLYLNYEKLIGTYEQEKSWIPPGQLAEIRYEDLVGHPLETMQRLYGQFSLPASAALQRSWEKYIAEHPTLRRSRNPSAAAARQHNRHLEHWVRFYGYEVIGV